jgi:hypothetical protein
MIETLVVRIFGVDVSDTEVSKPLYWKDILENRTRAFEMGDQNM